MVRSFLSGDGWFPSEPAVPLGERAADLVRRVLLDEMHAADRHLALIGPSAAELPLRSDENRPGVSVDEQLRNRALSHPFRVCFRDRYHVGGLAVDRYLPRPLKCGPARFARLPIRRAISLHLLVRELSQDAARKDPLHEQIALKDHLLARGTPQRLEDIDRALR